ncbi:MAG TPA: homocysteine S-methyltransferase family protein, partial [Candidatus Polarisedimenticolia bacterium]|nr:homocysteine S-methyltransferase family protein [Candidatus Polarisedimenticolia bacterium]
MSGPGAGGAPDALGRLLGRRRPVLLDGATGTELTRRGLPTTLPLWSAHALANEEGLAVLRAIHEDYVRAGAEIVVTNTFRTTRWALERAGAGDRWRLFNRRAVECARTASGSVPGHTCLVAGGLAPLEDCYRPDLVPSAEVCLAEHRRQVDLLAGLGVDLILIETMNRRREAEAALRAAAASGLDVVLSL